MQFLKSEVEEFHCKNRGLRLPCNTGFRLATATGAILSKGYIEW